MTKEQFQALLEIQLENSWQSLCRYSEQLEQLEKRTSREAVKRAIAAGNINEIAFYATRAYFEACFYGRAPWTAGEPSGVAG